MELTYDDLAIFMKSILVVSFTHSMYTVKNFTVFNLGYSRYSEIHDKNNGLFKRFRQYYRQNRIYHKYREIHCKFLCKTLVKEG